MNGTGGDDGSRFDGEMVIENGFWNVTQTWALIVISTLSEVVLRPGALLGWHCSSGVC